MESDAHALKTGLFLLLAGALLAAVVLLFSDRQAATRSYLVYSSDSVGGLATESRVYYKGVEVGRVTSIGFEEGDFERVRIIIRVDETIPLGENTYAELELRGITGEYDLSLDIDGELGAPLEARGGDLPEIPMRSRYITRLGEAVEQGLDDFRGVARNLEALTDEENRAQIRALLADWTAAGNRLVVLQEEISGTAEQLAPSLARLPETLASFEDAMGQVQQAAAALGERTAGLDGLIGSTTEAASSLDQLLVDLDGRALGDLNETLRTLRRTLRQLGDLAQGLADDPQRLLLGAPERRPGPGERTGGD